MARRKMKRAADKVRRYVASKTPNTGKVTLSNSKKLFGAAATGAVGALAVDVVMGKLPLPAALATGMGRNLTKLAAAVGVGMVVSKFGKGSWGTEMARGAMTVALHGAAKEALNTYAGMNVGEYVNGYETVGYLDPNTVAAIEGDDMSAYDVAAYDVAGDDIEISEYVN